jgi:hypothetical protein
MVAFGDLVLAAVCAVGVTAASLPTVDLGYTVHRATLNDTGYGYYNFSNIRFGAAPSGELRFRAPQEPSGKNRTVNDGQQNVVCPQAGPVWAKTAGVFIPEYLTGTNISTILKGISQYPTADEVDPRTLLSLLPKAIPGTSEDCLFLDVVVPKSVFSGAKKRNAKRGKGGEF